MDPSEEKEQDTLPPDTKRSNKRSYLVPVILIVLLLSTIIGIAFYFFSGSQPSVATPVASESSVDDNTIQPIKKELEEKQQESQDSSPTPITTELPPPVNDELILSDFDSVPPEEVAPEDHSETNTLSPVISQIPIATRPQIVKKVSTCNKPALQLHDFYSHLDGQPYMAEYKLPTSSEKHFSALIQKLLANPPQVTRESDDLYTILKNTAHFFRICGKENILMLKGILDNEKSRVEQILSDYYMLVTIPECSTTPFVADIDRDALYEYACFFLNTMGGRLYLFRRDSLSRMVVTYYAILLVEQANINHNNKHGIELRPVVDMLISEMEAGGSTLQHSDSYLDSLYDLKEKYQ